MKNVPFLVSTITIMMLSMAWTASNVNPMSEEITSEQEWSQNKFKVTLAEAKNGSYIVTPEIPADGMIDAGTELTVKANPLASYSLDAIYYTVKGGMWGTTSYESFAPEMKITVDRDMIIGAVFVASSLVNNIHVTHDVVYAQPGVKPLKYDVFSPKGAKGLPCVVIVHGGGWSSNNEDIMRGLARELVKEGQYVVFSIDYRWVKDLDGDKTPNHMHHLIEDVFGAIAHIQEHAASYGADPQRMAVTGDSAGGHLSAAAATLSPMIGNNGFGVKEGVYEYMPTYMPYSKTVDQVKADITQAIQAVAPSYGPFTAKDFKMFVVQTDQGYWDAISPIMHIPDASTRKLPHFIVRGSIDPVVPAQAVLPYVDKLKTASQKVKYIEVPDASHAFFDWKPDAVTRATFAKYGVPYAAEMKQFFDEVFNSDK